MWHPPTVYLGASARAEAPRAPNGRFRTATWRGNLSRRGACAFMTFAKPTTRPRASHRWGSSHTQHRSRRSNGGMVVTSRGCRRETDRALPDACLARRMLDDPRLDRHHQLDIRRAKTLATHGLHYVDVGTSGGVWGEGRGYCQMIGGRVSDSGEGRCTLHAAIDATLFAREDAIEEEWRIVAPILAGTSRPLEYEVGSWGPPEAEGLIDPSGGQSSGGSGGWHNPQPGGGARGHQAAS